MIRRLGSIRKKCESSLKAASIRDFFNFRRCTNKEERRKPFVRWFFYIRVIPVEQRSYRLAQNFKKSTLLRFFRWKYRATDCWNSLIRINGMRMETNFESLRISLFRIFFSFFLFFTFILLFFFSFFLFLVSVKQLKSPGRGWKGTRPNSVPNQIWFESQSRTQWLLIRLGNEHPLVPSATFWSFV